MQQETQALPLSTAKEVLQSDGISRIHGALLRNVSALRCFSRQIAWAYRAAAKL
jgi:hypothetical protein